MQVKYLYEIRLNIGIGENQDFDFYVAAMNPEEAEKKARESILEDHAAWMESTGPESINNVLEMELGDTSAILEQIMDDDDTIREFVESLRDPQVMGERYAEAIMNARLVSLKEMGKIVL